MDQSFARILIVAGLMIAGIGVILLLLGRFVRLGHLPGDLRIERPGGSFFFPLGTSILVSVILTLLLNLVLRLWRR